MKLVSFEKTFEEEYFFDELKQKTINNIQSILDNSDSNFLKDSIDELPQGILFSDLKIEYRATYIMLKKANGAKPSFRLVFDLLEPNDDEELFTYEIEYNSDSEYLDDFFLDY